MEGRKVSSIEVGLEGTQGQPGSKGWKYAGQQRARESRFYSARFDRQVWVQAQNRSVLVQVPNAGFLPGKVLGKSMEWSGETGRLCDLHCKRLHKTVCLGGLPLPLSRCDVHHILLDFIPPSVPDRDAPCRVRTVRAWAGRDTWLQFSYTLSGLRPVPEACSRMTEAGQTAIGGIGGLPLIAISKCSCWLRTQKPVPIFILSQTNAVLYSKPQACRTRLPAAISMGEVTHLKRMQSSVAKACTGNAMICSKVIRG